MPTPIRYHTTEWLSEHMAETPEGFLLCRDVPIARAGVLEYAPGETPVEGVAGADRMVAYTQENIYVRFPLVPLQRTPVEFRGINQLTTYFGKLGEVEFVYPETIGYADGL